VRNSGTSTRSQSPTTQLPRQVAVGWSTSKPAGPLDLALYTQVIARSDWASAAGGLEVGYSWIEGHSITMRAGARRPDDTTEKPISLGAALTGDRLTLEYAVRFYDNDRQAQVVTLRWR